MKLFLITLFFFLLLEDEDYHPTTYVFPAFKHTLGIRRAGATELFLFMGFKVKFRNPEGLACARLDSWEDPEDPHDDDELTVYGVNSGQNNIIYNSSMWGLDVFNIDEDDGQPLNNPHGICANSRGDVYIADTGNHRIVRLFNPAHELHFVSTIGTKGKKDGHFNYPRQLTLDNNGNLFVSDSANNRVQVFDSSDSFRLSITAEGYLKGPNGIMVTDSIEKHARFRDSFLIVVDSSDQRINKFDLSGNLITAVSMPKIGFEESKLEYVAIDYHNQVLITDSKNHCIHKFSKDLDYIISFGREGDDDFEFLEPKGITIYRRFGQLFVAESTGAQYFWVGTDIMDLTHKVEKEGVLFTFKITEPSFLTADIFDGNDKFVMRLTHRRFLINAGTHILKWSGFIGKTNKRILKENEFELSDKVSVGEKAPAGRYKVKFSLEATYSSRTHFVRVEEEEINYFY